MLSFDLGTQLSGSVFAFLLLFCRLGSSFMLFPGIGEAFVATRVRLAFALTVTFILLPILSPELPIMPANITSLFLILIKEIFIGIFWGSIMRLFMSAIEIAGSVVAVQIGLSNAMVLNPSMASQSALPSAFLGIAAVTLLFVTGLDHLLLGGLVETYRIFPPGDPLIAADFAETYMTLVAKTFKAGAEIAAPFLVVGLLLYVAVGFIQKLMPQIQLFIVMLPVQIGGGFFLMASAMSVILTVWLRFFGESLASLIGH